MDGSVDFSVLEEMDPSLEGGFRLAFDKEVACELRYFQIN